MNLWVYVREETMYLVEERGEKVAEGVLDSDASAGELCGRHAVNRVTLVIGRPKTFVRTLSFPFASASKVGLVIEEELRALFPLPLEELVVSWHPVCREKSGLTVLVTAWERKTLLAWEALKKTHKFSLAAGCEHDILFTLARARGGRDFDALFADRGYACCCSARNGVVAGISSAFFDGDAIPFDRVSPLERSGPLFVFGDASCVNGLPQTPAPVSMQAPRVSERTLLFDLLLACPATPVRPGFRAFSLRTPGFVFSPALGAGIAVYAACAFLLVRPVFLARSFQAESARASRVLEEAFRNNFPAVTRLVNPVAQAEEKVREFRQVKGTAVAGVSPLLVMKAVAEAVPETIPFRVSQFTLNGDTLFLACVTTALADVDRCAALLREAGIFREVKIGQISFGTEGVNFTVVLNTAHEPE